MIVGYGFKVDRGSTKIDDASELQKVGCEKIFVNESVPFSHFELQQVLEFLRKDDILLVVDVARLGRDVYEIISVVDRLRKVGVILRAERNQIIPDTPLGDQFATVCAIFSELHNTGQGARRSSAGRRRRGRPTVLTEDDQLRAHHLLDGGRTSVLEVARQLGVSPATIYRYFPRREHSSSTRKRNS